MLGPAELATGRQHVHDMPLSNCGTPLQQTEAVCYKNHYQVHHIWTWPWCRCPRLLFWIHLSAVMSWTAATFSRLLKAMFAPADMNGFWSTTKLAYTVRVVRTQERRKWSCYSYIYIHRIHAVAGKLGWGGGWWMTNWGGGGGRWQIWGWGGVAVADDKWGVTNLSESQAYELADMFTGTEW